MQRTEPATLLSRMAGVLRLDRATYAGIARDPDATVQAALVVALAAVADGVGAIRDNGWLGLLGGIVGGIVGWLVFAFLATVVGRWLGGRTPTTNWSALLRTLGFAYTPTLLSVFGFIPILGGLLAAVGSLWFLLTSIVALRDTLEVGTGRAIVVGIVAVVIAGVALGLIAAVFGITAYGL